MDIYLPIAEVSVNWPLLVLLGATVGFVSGLFGIGGGFLMAPILVFLGIPPTVAVASQASHVVASSTSGVISYTSQKAVDYRIGGVMALDLGAGGAGGGLSLAWGAFLCFGSVVSFAIGSRLTVTAFPKETPLGRTAVTLTGAAIAALIVAGGQVGLGGEMPSFAAWGWKEIGAILLFSVGALGISQVMWIMSVERLGIGLSALHINAAPFYVMLILFALGGLWNWPQAFAAALVGLGVLIAQGILPLPFGRR